MRVFVVDDEKLSVDYLCRLLANAQIEAHGFTNPLEALKEVTIRKPEVLFLDIEMPELNGLEFAERIQEIDYNCEIVFITAYNQYAIDAFRANAIDYLLKPVMKDTFQKSLERIEKRIFKSITYYSASEKTVKNEIRKIRITLFGSLTLSIGDESVPVRFMTGKCSELLAYLLLIGRDKEVYKWKIIDDLWADKDAEKGDINLRSTVSRLNKTLRENQIKLAVKSTGKSYILENKEEKLEIDAFALEKLVHTSLEVTDSNYIEYENAIKNYQGELLYDIEGDWCSSLKNRYHNCFLLAADRLLNYYSISTAEQLKLRSLSLIEEVIKSNPYDERFREKEIRLRYLVEGEKSAHKYYVSYQKEMWEEMRIKITKSFHSIVQER